MDLTGRFAAASTALMLSLAALAEELRFPGLSGSLEKVNPAQLSGRRHAWRSRRHASSKLSQSVMIINILLVKCTFTTLQDLEVVQGPAMERRRASRPGRRIGEPNDVDLREKYRASPPPSPGPPR